jgi:adenine-specific DNA-methyltransferase
MSKKKPDVPKVEKTSADLAKEGVSRLRELFPEAVSEGRIDFEKLRETLGDEVDDRPERYSFTWAGKRDAIRLLQTPSRATLVPAPKESVDFDTTENVFIEGENLEVLKLLYKSYAGRVKMIYIDPPYNTGNDFIYPDDFRDPLDNYLKLTGQKDAEGNLLTSNPETSGRFHSAWLSMMYPRLFVAKQLLREDGVIFVTIDDHEVADLRLLMNEIFGEENFVVQIEWEKRYTRSNNTEGFTSVVDHVVVYQKSQAFRPNLLAREQTADDRYENLDDDPRGPWKPIPFLNPLSPEERPNLAYEIVNPNTGERIRPEKKAWRSSQSVFEAHLRDGRIWWGKNGRSNVPNVKRFLSEVRKGMTPINLWQHEFAGHTDLASKEVDGLFGDRVFDTPKPTLLIQRMLQLSTEPHEEHIVLDFFSGSSTTAHAVLRQNREDGGNRRFVLVQMPEPVPPSSPAHKAGFRDIAEIGRERMRRAIVRMSKEGEGRLDLGNPQVPEDLGFRAFELAESNYRPWRGVATKDGETYSETMALFTDPLVPGWNPTNVIYEVALKEGYSLTAKVDRIGGVGENTVYRVTDPEKGQSFLICLDDVLKVVTTKALSLKKDSHFVCRDRALTDEQAANLALQCQLKTI